MPPAIGSSSTYVAGASPSNITFSRALQPLKTRSVIVFTLLGTMISISFSSAPKANVSITLRPSFSVTDSNSVQPAKACPRMVRMLPGKTTAFIFVPANARFPISSRPSSNSIISIPEFMNTPNPHSRILFGIVICCREVQFSKASLPICKSDFGSRSFESSLQSLNAPPPIVSKFSGKVISARAGHFQNAAFPMAFTESGILTDFIFPAKAFCPISVTSLPSTFDGITISGS